MRLYTLSASWKPHTTRRRRFRCDGFLPKHDAGVCAAAAVAPPPQPAGACSGERRTLHAGGTSAAAERLLQEVKRAEDSAATTTLAERQQARRKVWPSGKAGFQINIRQALADLDAQQSAHYLARMTPVLTILSRQAADALDAGEASQLAGELGAAAGRLRAK